MRSWPPALYRCGCVRTTVAASACIRTSTHACRRAGHSFVVGGDPGSARLPACGGLSAGSARSFAPSLRPVDVQHARLAAGGDARASHVTNSQPQVVTFPPSHFLRPPAARGPLRVLQLCTAPCHVRPVRRQPATCPPRERRMLVRQAQVSRSLRTWQCWPRPPWPPSRAIFCATGVCVHGCSQCCRISWSSSPPSVGCRSTSSQLLARPWRSQAGQCRRGPGESAEKCRPVGQPRRFASHDVLSLAGRASQSALAARSTRGGRCASSAAASWWVGGRGRPRRRLLASLPPRQRPVVVVAVSETCTNGTEALW